MLESEFPHTPKQDEAIINTLSSYGANACISESNLVILCLREGSPDNKHAKDMITRLVATIVLIKIKLGGKRSRNPVYTYMLNPRYRKLFH